MTLSKAEIRTVAWKSLSSNDNPSFQTQRKSPMKFNFMGLYGIWSGRQDLNLRHPAPKAGALPSCATPRLALQIIYEIAFEFFKRLPSMADDVFDFGR